MTRATAIAGFLIALAFPAAAPAASCSLPLVLIPCISVDWPASPAAFGTVQAGTTTDISGGSLVVSANQSWGVRIRTDHATGRLREWSGAAYTSGGAVSANPLQWRLTSINGTPQGGSFAALSSTAATVVTGRPSTGCVLGGLCGTDTLAMSLRWKSSFADPAKTYRTEVTYEAALGF